jgi:hypothetical protein
MKFWAWLDASAAGTGWTVKSNVRSVLSLMNRQGRMSFRGGFLSLRVFSPHPSAYILSSGILALTYTKSFSPYRGVYSGSAFISCSFK